MFRNLPANSNLESTLTFCLSDNGDKTAAQLQDDSKLMTSFDSLCQSAIADSEMSAGLVEKDHKAFLKLRFIANSSELNKVEIQVSLDKRGIVPIRKTFPPIKSPDWDSMKVKGKSAS